MAVRYIPARGDPVWITFNPQVGHEQAGRRSALMLSPSSYNRKVGLAILCPITSQVKGYPFEVTLGMPHSRRRYLQSVHGVMSYESTMNGQLGGSSIGLIQMRLSSWKSLANQSDAQSNH